MGGSESSLAMLHSVPDIEEAIKHSRTSDSVQSSHGWLSSLSSPNFEVSSNGITAVLKKADPGTHYRVTNNRQYTEGVHLFQFRWQADTEKRVCIGVCTKEMDKLQLKGDLLLGSDDQSVAWDLHTRQIYYNSCAIKNYPENKFSTYKIPEKIIMILNMDLGTLSFKADGEDLGIAMSGLKHIAQEMLVVASSNTEGNSLEMKYLGGTETLKESEDVDDNQNLNDEGIKFHSRCGVNIKLSDNNAKAVRNNPRKTYNGATVMTNRSLDDGESVKLIVGDIDSMSNWTGSLVVGVTTLSPDTISFPTDAMTDCSEGNTWAIRMKELKHNGKYIEDTDFDLDDVKSGQVFEISLSGETVTITCAGKKVTSFSVGGTRTLFACVDVYGQNTSVSIKQGNKGKSPAIKKSTAMTVASLFEMMDRKKVEEIPLVLKGVNIHLSSPLYGIKGKKLKKLAAEELANSSALKTMKSYMDFLIEKHPGSSEAAECYKAFILVCLCYTDINLQFAKKLGDHEVLSLLMRHIGTMDSAIYDTKNNTENLETVLMVLHNAAQAKENRGTFQTFKFIREAKTIVENKNTYGVESRMIAVLAMSYVHLPAELPQLLIDDDLAKHIVTTLEKTISATDHSYNRWSTRKVVSGIANIATHKPNASLLIHQEVLEQLIKMLKFYEAYDKECALNAIWSLINENTNIAVFATDGLMVLLKQLSEVADESVKQAAVRVMAKAKFGQVIVGATSTKCVYQTLCERFKDSLKLVEAFFSPEFDMCYCEQCHADRGDLATFIRGEPPKSYGIPVGWYRFGLKSHPRAAALGAFDKWHRAFHGTRVESVEGILTVGDIAPAGRKVLGGTDIKELPGHFSDAWYKPDGFNTKRVFLSPSMRYSGVPAYAKPSKFKDNIASKTYTAQVAFQVLVNPSSYSVEKETIGAESEIDPNFSNQEIEWVVEEQGAILLYGFLVKIS